ncbi:MAG TPA: proton-conducting transporter membrane subunit, partial [Opitutaceae bacterium]|nr:proton-conducting transporter membrane subunit [Opitutaceae bacterium]
MTNEFLQQAAASNQWAAIFPELMLAGLALMLLILEILLPKKDHDLIPAFAIFGQLAIALGLAFNFSTAFLSPQLQVSFGGLLRHSETGQFMRMFFLGSSIFVSLLATVSLAKQAMPRVEFFHIVLVVTAALMLLVQANHFVLLFVALETVTIGFYILVSYFRANPLSLEAGLKYLILGA